MSTEQRKHQQQRIEFQERILVGHHWASCVNCEYWVAEKEDCKRYASRPPAHVIVVGCQDWIYDIPF